MSDRAELLERLRNIADDPVPTLLVVPHQLLREAIARIEADAKASLSATAAPKWVSDLAAQYGARQMAALKGDEQLVRACNKWIAIIVVENWLELRAMLAAAPAPAQGEPVAMPKPPYDPDYLLEVAENTLIPVDEKKKAALFAVCDLFSKPDGYVKPAQVDHGGQSVDSQGTAARVEETATAEDMARLRKLIPGCDCENPAQCWEPCGTLGHSEKHARVVTNG